MTTHPDLEKIRRASNVLQKLILTLIPALPVGIVLTWMFLDLEALDIHFTLDEVGPLTATERWLAASLNLLPLAVTLYALFNLQKLFGLYATGQVFTSETVRCFRNMGWALIIMMPVNILFHSALSVLLSFDHPAGERMLAVSLSSNHLGMAIVGTVIVIISWVMAEATRIAQENAEII